MNKTPILAAMSPGLSCYLVLFRKNVCVNAVVTDGDTIDVQETAIMAGFFLAKSSHDAVIQAAYLYQVDAELLQSVTLGDIPARGVDVVYHVNYTFGKRTYQVADYTADAARLLLAGPPVPLAHAN